MDILSTIIQVLEHINWLSLFHFFRSVFLCLDVLLLAGLVFSTMKSLEWRPKFVWNALAGGENLVKKDPVIEGRWRAVLQKAALNPPQSYTLAIIEADKVPDEALKHVGLQGEHMADRLEKLNGGDMRTLEGLWRVHRLRNELVHAPDFDISEVDAKDVLAVYEKFLKELGVL